MKKKYMANMRVVLKDYAEDIRNLASKLPPYLILSVSLMQDALDPDNLPEGVKEIHYN